MTKVIGSLEIINGYGSTPKKGYQAKQFGWALFPVKAGAASPPLIRDWENQARAVVARTKVGDFSGGAISPKSMANYDSLGTGPAVRFKIGKTTVYPVDALIDWLMEKMSR